MKRIVQDAEGLRAVELFEQERGLDWVTNRKSDALRQSGNVYGPPKPTERFTTAQLRGMDLVGVYERKGAE